MAATIAQASAWASVNAESNGQQVAAPTGHAITGRRHQNDENGPTQYRIGKVLINGAATETVDSHVGPTVKESESGLYAAPPGYAVIGRRHNGDEKGPTTMTFGRFRSTTPIAAPATISASPKCGS